MKAVYFCFVKNKVIQKGVVLLCLFYAFGGLSQLVWAQGVNGIKDDKNQTIGKGQLAFTDPIPPAAPSHYKPNEIIIKFTKDLSEKLENIISLKTSNNAAKLPHSLNYLNQKYGAKTYIRLFQDFRKQREKIENLRNKDEALLTESEEHLVTRLKRAPKDAKVPELYRIFKIELELKPGQRLEQAIAEYQNEPNVEYAEPNYIISICATPNDSLYSLQWSLNNTGQMYPASGAYNLPPGTPDADIDAPEAWDINTGSSSLIVAVVDTGIDYNHRDLTDNMWKNLAEFGGTPGVDDDGNGYVDDIYGYDFTQYNQSRDSDPMDENGHGTHCSGIIAARGNNSLDTSGVCWNLKIMALKTTDPDGIGLLDDAIDALYYAISEGADVISNSWGLYGRTETLELVVDYAYSQGVIIVGGAGNRNENYLLYPAAYETVISVAATDSNDEKASFSNWGWSLDLAAPGVDILSLRASGTSRGTVYDDYTTVLSGTSMSCPFVAAEAALILSQNPSFTVEEVKSILKMTCDPISTPSYIGQGRINTYEALQITNRPPIAILNTGSEMVYGTINITGTAKGDTFSNYSLYYHEGIVPGSSWVLFHTSTTPVDNGILYANFDTARIPDGYALLKLAVSDTEGRVVEEIRDLFVENFVVDFPLNNDILRAGDVFEIKAEVRTLILSHTLEHGVGFDPSVWSNQGVTLRDGTGGIWATWDTSFITENNFYCLKFTFNTPYGPRLEYVDMVYFDKRLRPGWPQYIIHEAGAFAYEDFQDVIVADLNGDHYKEIITIVNEGLYQPFPTKLLVYNYSGVLLWSEEFPYTFSYYSPVVGDLDNDGDMEIVIDVSYGTYRKMYAFHHDGSMLSGNWPLNLPTSMWLKVVADLNNDGQKEIIASSIGGVKVGSSYYKALLIIDSSGNIVRQMLTPTRGLLVEPESAPAVGNFDDDPDLEIVTMYGQNQVAVYNQDGTFVPGWPVSIDAFRVYGSMVVGDVNDDGYEEVVVTTMGDYNISPITTDGVYVYDRNGNLLPGWPVLKGHEYVELIMTASLGDFDYDGDLEICFVNLKYIYLYHHTGELVTGWPQMPNEYSPIYRNCVIGDINNDGLLDIVVTGGGLQPRVLQDGTISSSGGVWAWNFDGTRIDLNPAAEAYPIFMEHGIHIARFKAPATLTDLDFNGKLDIVASSVVDYAYASDRTFARYKKRNTIYVWELDVPYYASKMAWPMNQHDPQLTGRYRSLPASVQRNWHFYE